MRDPETVRLPDGGVDYLAGALDRAARGMPLRPVDVQELGYRIGIGEARRVARDVEAYTRDRQRWSGIHQSGDLPLPASLARLFTRLRSGQPLGPGDVRGLVGRLGRRGLRRLTRTASRTTASRARARDRHSTIRSRRGRR